MTSTLAPEERNGTDERTVIGRATSSMADVGAQVHATAGDATAMVADHVPAAIATSRGTVARVFGTLRGSSTGSLALGTVFAAGLSGGLYLSRAPRLLVAPAFLTTLLLGGTLLGRGTTDGGERSRVRRT